MRMRKISLWMVNRCVDALVGALSKLITCGTVHIEKNGTGQITRVRAYKLIIYWIWKKWQKWHYTTSHHHHDGGSIQQRKCGRCVCHQDEKDYWGVTDGKLYCAAATDSGDVGTDGTNLVWHVRVIGGALDNGRCLWLCCALCGWCHGLSSRDCVIFRGEDLRSSGDSTIAGLYLGKNFNNYGVWLSDLDAARDGEWVLIWIPLSPH